MDAAREQQVQGFGFGAVQQPLDLLLPQREGGARPDVSTALQPFEDEPPRPLGEVPLQQAGGGHVQVGPDPDGLQRGGLRRGAAGDDRVRRAGLGHGGQLLLAQPGRGETEQAHAPGEVPEPLGRLRQQPAYVGALHHREREVRDPARGGHRGGEGRLVAHPGHRALRDGVRPPEGPGPYRRFQVPGDGRPYGL